MILVDNMMVEKSLLLLINYCFSPNGIASPVAFSRNLLVGSRRYGYLTLKLNDIVIDKWVNQEGTASIPHLELIDNFRKYIWVEIEHEEFLASVLCKITETTQGAYINQEWVPKNNLLPRFIIEEYSFVGDEEALISNAIEIKLSYL